MVTDLVVGGTCVVAADLGDVVVTDCDVLPTVEVATNISHAAVKSARSSGTLILTFSHYSRFVLVSLGQKRYISCVSDVFQWLVK